MSAAAIKVHLRKRFPQREWCLAFEVANAAGHSSTRHADAVAMNLWPSRGLAIHGFEFKVQRSDWRRELKAPEKAEPVAQYCDHWWVIAMPGVVKLDELPAAWGLMELRQEGDTGSGDLVADEVGQGRHKLVVVKEAPRKPAIAMDRTFMASLFRRLGETDSEEIEHAVNTRVAAIEAGRWEKFDAKVAEAVKVQTYQHQRLLEAVEKFEAASGIKLAEWHMDGGKVGRAVNMVLRSGVLDAHGTFSLLRSVLADATQRIDRCMAEFDGTRLVPEEVVGADLVAIPRRVRGG